MQRILVVDDEPAIVAVVRDRLEREGFLVWVAASGEEALAQVEVDSPDLIVLDIMLPGIDGFEVLRQLRSAGHTVPVILLTARDDIVDRIVGLEIGGDDYLVKPFDPRELSARIHVQLRRQVEIRSLEARIEGISEVVGRSDALVIDGARRRVYFRGTQLELRPKEYDLLSFLAQHRGQVFTRDALLSHVWGQESFIGQRTVDVHVRRLRVKLAAIAPDDDMILTEWGIGYRLAEDV